MSKLRFASAALLAFGSSIPVLAHAQAQQPAGPPPSGSVTANTAAASAAAPSANTVAEVIVTATKRPQTLQSVPISVSVTDKTTIEQAHIVDLMDLQSVVPSLKVTQYNAVGQTNFIIRGFGNGNGNDGIESSVGVFVDGVYRSRSYASMDDLPDIERVEVLRGPQSTLFGKNVSAGAINIVTQAPQFSFGGDADLSLGDYDLVQARVRVTGPLSDTVALSLFASTESRDGYLHNDATGHDINNRDRQGVRADLLWKPSSDLSVRIIGDFNQIHERCCGSVQILNGPATQFIAAPAPFGLGAMVANPATMFNNHIDLNTDPRNKLAGGGVSVQVDYNAGFANFTSITAYRAQTNESWQDVDFTGADLANKDERSREDTFTQEFRLTSKSSGPVNWLVGAFFDDEKLTSGRDTTYGSQIRAYADGLSGTIASGPLAGHSNIFALEYLQSLVTPSIVPGGTYFQEGQGISDFYKMSQISYSLFGQADYKVTSRLTLTGGLAYMNDHKKAESDVVLDDPFSSLNLSDVPQLPYVGVPANAFAALGGLQFFYGNTANHAPVNFPNANESGILNGDQITYAARIAYDFGWVNTYLSYSTGWKAGAFNLSSDSRPPDANGIGRTAKPEDVSVYELGAKAKFPGGFFDIAIFDQAIRNFQTNDYVGTGYVLSNAGRESVRGVEIDSAYKPIRWLALTGAVTWLDPRYDSYVHAPCVVFDTVDCPVNPATGLMPLYRNLSGTRPAGIPEWSSTVSATLSRDFTDDLGAFLRLEYDYASPYQLTDVVPANISTYGTSTLNASLGFKWTRQRLELLFWGRNLADDRELVAAFPTVAQSGSYSGFPNEPRTYGVTIRKRF